MSLRRVAYISSKDYVSLCDQHPKVRQRASMVDSLISAYNLKSSLLTVTPKPATKDDLLSFHSNEYIESLENIQQTFSENYDCDIDESLEDDIDYDNDGEFGEITIYGFGYDCAIFRKIYDYSKAVVGATIDAANILSDNKADVAINLNGGWHHAHVDEAAGFCYINDVVIGILRLMNNFDRILYVDLDIHHGDGVEEAFMYSKKVMTLSLHNHENGFFPGSGGENDIGEGSGKYFTTNVPLKTGVDDVMFFDVFQNIFRKTIEKFDPKVIVCQCGADGLSGDPMGTFNLSNEGLVSCVKEICTKKIPVMILGGGGYNFPNTARCWTKIVAAVVDKHLDEDIPDHDYLEMYGPDYSIGITPSNRKNENSIDYVNKLVGKINKNIDCIQWKTVDQQKLLNGNNGNVTSKENTGDTNSDANPEIEINPEACLRDISTTKEYENTSNNNEIPPKVKPLNYFNKRCMSQDESQNSPKKFCFDK